MHEIVSSVNGVVSTLNHLSPEWYVAAVGPLANIAQHFLKLERQQAKKLTRAQNQILAVVLAGFAGAFYGVMHTTVGASLTQQVHIMLKDIALVGSPIWLVSTLLFFKVSQKLEERHELLGNPDGSVTINPDQPAETVTLTPVVSSDKVDF